MQYFNRLLLILCLMPGMAGCQEIFQNSFEQEAGFISYYDDKINYSIDGCVLHNMILTSYSIDQYWFSCRGGDFLEETFSDNRDAFIYINGRRVGCQIEEFLLISTSQFNMVVDCS